MTYIRVKKISNLPYAYLVENISTENGPRQKVKKYLGRVHVFNRNNKPDASITAANKLEFLKKLITKHLQHHGFISKNGNLTNQRVIFSTKELQFKTEVIALNNGFLCNHTIQQLLEFKKSKNLNDDAHSLAKTFLLAGLPVSKEEFICFYQLL